MTLTLRQKISLILLFFYWPFLSILTHFPFGPDLLRKFTPSDKALHILVFFILTFLLYSAGCSSEKVRLKNYSVWLILLTIILYAAADEWLQRFVGRNSNFSDFLANLIGILSAFLLLVMFFYRYAVILFLSFSIIMMTCAVQLKFTGWLAYTRAAFYLLSYALLTFFWIKYFSPTFSAKSYKVKWFLTALVLPIGHLSATILLSVLLKNSFRLREAFFSIIAIAAVVLFHISNDGCHSCESRNP
jgi:VanZ family protein